MQVEDCRAGIDRSENDHCKIWGRRSDNVTGSIDVFYEM